MLLVFESRRLDRFLLARHVERGWELPGGHVEPGEKPVEGARREWEEETGLPLSCLEQVARHTRGDGSMGHLFLGAVRDQSEGSAVKLVGAVDPRGRIIDQKWVRRLDEVAPLAFPGDPYDSLAKAVARRADTGDWRLPEGEDPQGFIRRVSQHPEAKPRGDPVEILEGTP